MVGYYSDLFIYASIYDRNKIDQNITRYKSLLNSSQIQDEISSC